MMRHATAHPMVVARALSWLSKSQHEDVMYRLLRAKLSMLLKKRFRMTPDWPSPALVPSMVVVSIYQLTTSIIPLLGL